MFFGWASKAFGTKSFVLRDCCLDPKSGAPVRLVGRQGGFCGWLRSLIGLDDTVVLEVSLETVRIKVDSLSGAFEEMVPMSALSNLGVGYLKPIGFLVCGVGLMPVIYRLTAAALSASNPIEEAMLWWRLGCTAFAFVSCVAAYFLRKCVAVHLIAASGSGIEVAFSRSLVEGVVMDEAMGNWIADAILAVRFGRQVPELPRCSSGLSADGSRRGLFVWVSVMSLVGIGGPMGLAWFKSETDAKPGRGVDSEDRPPASATAAVRTESAVPSQPQPDKAIAKPNHGGRAGRASLPERAGMVGSRVPRDRNGEGFAITSEDSDGSAGGHRPKDEQPTKVLEPKSPEPKSPEPKTPELMDRKPRAVIGNTPADHLAAATRALLAKDYPQAIEGYGKAAEAGDPRAFNALGLLFRNGLGVEADPEAAVVFFRAAVDDVAQANAGLAECFESGYGVRRNPLVARSYRRRALEMGDDTVRDKIRALETAAKKADAERSVQLARQDLERAEKACAGADYPPLKAAVRAIRKRLREKGMP